MVDVQPIAPGLLHVVFLERAAREHDSAQSRFGQAAFLVLRLVDLLAAGQTTPHGDDLFGYQAAATGRYCQEQLESGAPADCLHELVSAASYAHRRHDAGLIAPAMLGLARWLIDSGQHFEEALDVLATLQRTAGARLDPKAAITAALITGRAQRERAQFDAADDAYGRAAELAETIGDGESVLLSQLGRANVFWGRGNLAQAERCNREVARSARAAGFQETEARAEQGLGVALGARGQLHDAVPHLWRAFELYTDEAGSVRALQDLGYALVRLGVIESAERAFKIVIHRSASMDIAGNATIELMYCASFRRDRVGFERWRGECARIMTNLAPNQVADYHLKLGIGLGRFGRIDRAAIELQLALQVAGAHGLHEFEFRIERILGGLAECSVYDTDHVDAEQPAGTGLFEVSTALAGLLQATT
jgi:tetratricopeptide (TPR) repeat protein